MSGRAKSLPHFAGPLAEVREAFAAYLALEDDAHIPFALGVAVTAHAAGDPLWGMIVASPSSSKTEVVRALDQAADAHPDEITAAGLLSWSRGREPRPVGLLARHQGRVFATIADFSTVLAMSDRGARDQLFALLRRAYDGAVARELGNAPGPLLWTGRLTLLAAATPNIDAYSSHADALGPRWLYCRVREASRQGRKAASLTSRLGAEALRRHRAATARLAAEVVVAAAARLPDVALSDELGDRIDDAAMLTCLGRASVARDGYGSRDIIGLAVVEEPPRLVGQLAHLARALLALGLTATEAAELCERCALDSMPLARRGCLAALAHRPKMTAAAVARQLGSNRKVALHALEELQAIGLTSYAGAEDDEADERRRNDPPKEWHLSGEYADLPHRLLGPPRRPE